MPAKRKRKIRIPHIEISPEFKKDLKRAKAHAKMVKRIGHKSKSTRKTKPNNLKQQELYDYIIQSP